MDIETLLSETQKSPNMVWLEACLARGEYEKFSEFHVLTPQMAEFLLKLNPDNRPLNKIKLGYMVADIEQDRWDDDNGETIIISKEGLLNTGQHRCHAVIKAGRSIRTNFAFGVSRESRKSTDTGYAKTAGNLLAMENIQDGNNIAAACSHYFQYRKSNRISRAGRAKPTKATILQVFADNPNITLSLSMIPRVGSKMVGGTSILTFCHYVFSQRNIEQATFFIQKLVQGDNLDSDSTTTSAIFYCRNRLLSEKRLRPEDKVELIFRAWNAFRTQTIVTKLPIMGNQLPDVI